MQNKPKSNTITMMTERQYIMATVKEITTALKSLGLSDREASRLRCKEIEELLTTPQEVR